VRDERLRAVQHPGVALEPRGRLEVPRGGAAARLGQRERAERLPAQQRAEPSLVLLGGAEPREGVRRQTDRGLERDRDGRVVPPDLLEREAEGKQIAALASELLRER